MVSEWFGTFLPYTDNWIFHFQMGWLYISDFTLKTCGSGRKKKDGSGQPRIFAPTSIRILRVIGCIYCLKSWKENFLQLRNGSLGVILPICGLSIQKAEQNWQANHHIDHTLPACRKAANGLPPWDWQVF